MGRWDGKKCLKGGEGEVHVNKRELQGGGNSVGVMGEKGMVGEKGRKKK